jgi:hypothetical protein
MALGMAGQPVEGPEIKTDRVDLDANLRRRTVREHMRPRAC